VYIGIYHQTLLVRGDDLFLRRVEIQYPILEILDVLDQWQLEMQARCLHHAARFAEHEYERLLRFPHREDAAPPREAPDRQGRRHGKAWNAMAHVSPIPPGRRVALATGGSA